MKGNPTAHGLTPFQASAIKQPVVALICRSDYRSLTQMIRYFDKHAIDTLRTGRLKVSTPSDLNDPFEFLLNHKDSVRDDEWLRKITDKDLRVICFCDPRRLTNNGDVLMWSHYAKKHSGFRIHIDGNYLRDVCLTSFDIEYNNIVPLLDTFASPEDVFRANEEYECLVAVFRAKGMFWRYEKEVRYFLERAACKYDAQHKFSYIDLPPHAVRRVDIGLTTSNADEYKLEQILKEPKYAHVDLRFARRVKGRFALAYHTL